VKRTVGPTVSLRRPNIADLQFVCETGRSTVSLRRLLVSVCSAVSEKLSENMHVVANEPSLAFFRIQEHVHKTLPPLVDKKVRSYSLYVDW